MNSDIYWMKKESIWLVPVGGLANRMRAIDSAVALSRQCGSELHIVWFKDPGLNCRFDQLFAPIDQPRVTVTEASKLDLLRYDRPRRQRLRVQGGALEQGHHRLAGQRRSALLHAGDGRGNGRRSHPHAPHAAYAVRASARFAILPRSRAFRDHRWGKPRGGKIVTKYIRRKGHDTDKDAQKRRENDRQEDGRAFIRHDGGARRHGLGI